jgi:hypothetical protein
LIIPIEEQVIEEEEEKEKPQNWSPKIRMRKTVAEY